MSQDHGPGSLIIIVQIAQIIDHRSQWLLINQLELRTNQIQNLSDICSEIERIKNRFLERLIKQTIDLDRLIEKASISGSIYEAVVTRLFRIWTNVFGCEFFSVKTTGLCHPYKTATSTYVEFNQVVWMRIWKQTFLPVNLLSRQPCPKRARQESSAEDKYSCYIRTAESALRALQALAEGKANPSAAAPPQWLESRLQELQTLITHIGAARRTT